MEMRWDGMEWRMEHQFGKDTTASLQTLIFAAKADALKLPPAEFGTSFDIFKYPPQDCWMINSYAQCIWSRCSS